MIASTPARRHRSAVSPQVSPQVGPHASAHAGAHAGAQVDAHDGAAAGPFAGRRPAVRRARPVDVPAIAALINRFAADQLMLPKAPEAIALAIDDFVVATDGAGRLLGCGALREYSPSVAEVASVAVAPDTHGLGVGSAIVRRVEQLAQARGTAALFALTLTPAFFQSLGYAVTDRSHFPEKVQRDCAGCSRRAACREICVARHLGGAASRAA